MESPQIRLVSPDSPTLYDATREIFREYAQSLGVDLGFQDFERELATLPGEYAVPAGRLLLAFVDEELAGCGGFRPIADVDYANACEMKRLYVRKPFRRFGLGRTIAQQLIDDARRSGYSVMLLDTLDEMEAARTLYTTLGFEEIPPYYYNPLPGAHYLKAVLD
ncbi:GNAT family N-acetyltransferase [Schlegelella sp. S2-27]|uniref:GNAT family N-acetyltransferase n=1 Tax=Caldimonas mangrovi TaxID=2944811 RepID=A0ABT0YSJ3_9BURK|nr:GNAT family N-acetyltransferase [Caldimonas mangrovi]MCM5681686.1 GNAT family N-acetyltransferase [Caldimonas mangrovi]